MTDPAPEFERPTEVIYGWVEQGSSIMFKAVTSFGDPVELSAEEAREVLAALLRLVERLEAGPA